MRTYDIISFHPGRQHNIEQATELARLNKGSFKHLTSLYFDEHLLYRLQRLSRSLGRALNKRTGRLSKKFVDTNPLPEVEIILRRDFIKNISPYHYRERNRKFQEWVLRKYTPPKVCIGFDTSSWLVFERWRSASKLILDLSIAVPQYKKTLAQSYGLSDAFVQQQTKGDEQSYSIYIKELELADVVLCGSEFVKQSCRSIGVPEEKLKLLPYGIDLSHFSRKLPVQHSEKKVKVVFIGTFGYRKGADITLLAWRAIAEKCPEVELHVYGNVEIKIPADLTRMFFHGFIDQESLVRELSSAHVAILPTFFEGSSLAVYQAMAMGLVVITTANSGSIITNRQNGLLIPYGSVTSLIEAILLLVEDAVLREQISANAQLDVQAYTWEKYGSNLQEVLNESTTSFS